MTLGYNIGSFIGKSSLICFKVPTIEVVTAALTFLVVLMGYFTMIAWYNLLLEVGLNLLVGLLSGINMIQGLQSMLKDEKMDKQNREVTIVFQKVVTKVGTILGFFSSLLIAKFLLPYKGDL